MHRINDDVINAGWRQVGDRKPDSVAVVDGRAIRVWIGLDDAFHQFFIGCRGATVAAPTVAGVINDFDISKIAPVVQQALRSSLERTA